MKISSLLLAGALLCAGTVAAESGLVTIPSKYSVAETMNRLESAARADKFQIFARVDFQALAAANGGAVKPNQILLFGRGGVLPPLLSVKPVAAVDLPLKALVWEDGEGKVWLTFNTGEYLRERHGVSGKDDVLKRLTDVTRELAQKATN